MLLLMTIFESKKYIILILCNVIRNKRDSRFFPGNKPAGILGITKKLLFFIENHVNGIGFQVYIYYIKGLRL